MDTTNDRWEEWIQPTIVRSILGRDMMKILKITQIFLKYGCKEKGNILNTSMKTTFPPRNNGDVPFPSFHLFLSRDILFKWPLFIVCNVSLWMDMLFQRELSLSTKVSIVGRNLVKRSENMLRAHEDFEVDFDKVLNK